MGGGWVGVLDEIKAILSPAGAWLWAELGKKIFFSSDYCGRTNVVRTNDARTCAACTTVT